STDHNLPFIWVLGTLRSTTDRPVSDSNIHSEQPCSVYSISTSRTISPHWRESSACTVFRVPSIKIDAVHHTARAITGVLIRVWSICSLSKMQQPTGRLPDSP